ncbi:hypothetical protein C0Q70_14301 [Pomacea canaliculata]|uniref:Beta-lactamase-related domain-containing protein n=1 Tax=Pomacea canaliculata TaxID=400727 RepID=A0A2T7NZM7_POMCA|nr:hypothetical protein C0Q70_14301 [Pomacea canaliculata]
MTEIKTTAAELPAALQQQMDEVIQQGMRCRNIPGLAVAIVKDGQGSLFNDSLRSTYATVEDLLAHRLGIPENNYIRLSTDITRQNLVERIRYLPNEGGFRDSFFYNNLMYTLAAVITESLGGRPWEDMVRESIFTPLGMNRSTFVTQADFGDNVALPMCSESGVGLVKCSLDFIRHWGSFIGSGNVFSSARDMSQWLLCLLNDGTAADGRRVLAQGLVDTLHKPQNTIPLSSYAKTPNIINGSSRQTLYICLQDIERPIIQVQPTATTPTSHSYGTRTSGSSPRQLAAITTEPRDRSVGADLWHWTLEAAGECWSQVSGTMAQDPPILNMTFEFLVGSDDVYGVKAPGFESPIVPIFYRRSDAAVIG